MPDDQLTAYGVTNDDYDGRRFRITVVYDRHAATVYPPPRAERTGQPRRRITKPRAVVVDEWMAEGS